MENEIKYHFLYKTICRVTGKYYIGVHSTYNLEDGYLGSGKLLKKSIKKYGIENHNLEILKFFKNKEDKFKAEKEYITLEMINDINCLNFSYGGFGGIQNKEHYEKFMDAGRLALKEKLKDPIYKEDYYKKCGLYKLRQEGNLLTWKDTYDWTGKKHKSETIEKQKQTYKKIGHSQGEKNSQFGKKWITNGIENKKIYKNEILPKGWRDGRIMGEDFSNKVSLGIIGKSIGRASTEEKELERRKKISITMLNKKNKLT